MNKFIISTYNHSNIKYYTVCQYQTDGEWYARYTPIYFAMNYVDALHVFNLKQKGA